LTEGKNGDIKKTVKPHEILCFHDEFMSRIDDFSLSWRNQALNELKQRNTIDFKTN